MFKIYPTLFHLKCPVIVCSLEHFYMFYSFPKIPHRWNYIDIAGLDIPGSLTT